MKQDYSGICKIGLHTGVKQCTFQWLISNDIAHKEMVFNGLVLPSFDYDHMHQLWNSIYYISTKIYQYILLHFKPV